MKEKILIVEDVEELGTAIKTILQYNNYDVTITTNGKEALEQCINDFYDVIIMDIMMPVMDGITALKEIRGKGIDTPVILLTAKSEIDDKVKGLDSGANDYLTKPFNTQELLARIRALLRINSSKAKKIQIGNITFDKENSTISNNLLQFNLNNKESELLETLVENPNEEFSNNEIIKRVWKTDNIKEDTVSIYMSYLQTKFQALNADININKENGYTLQIK